MSYTGKELNVPWLSWSIGAPAVSVHTNKVNDRFTQTYIYIYVHKPGHQLGHTPQSFTVSKLWWHLQEVVVLQIQRPQLVHVLQLQRVYGPHLVVAEQDGLQCSHAIQDAGKNFKSSGRKRKQNKESQK